MSKSFLTYHQQMEKLRDDKSIKCSGSTDKITLVRNGYFNLVNGYKLPFSSFVNANGDHVYESGTSVEHMKAVKIFDDKLRLLLFSHIVGVEEEIRTLTGYKFDETNNKGSKEWFQIDSYDTNRCEKLKIAELISRLMGDLRNSKSTYLLHYQNNHQVVPTWILTKVIRLSTFVWLLNFSKTPIKKELCELYGMLDGRNYPHYVLLIGSLQHIREVRNACAHNERVFDLTTSRRINSPYFNVLTISYNRSQNSDKKILDFVIYMRYYLDDDAFYSLVDEIHGLLMTLKGKISSNAFDYVRGKMGLKDENHLLLFKSIVKTKNYNNFG